MSIIDPDKKVEEGKEKREGIYQSSQQYYHFKNEGSEYENIQTQNNNDISENASFDTIQGIKENPHKEEKNKRPVVKESDSPEASKESGIPGTSEKDNIGTASSGARLGANKGRGTTDFPNKENA